MKENKDVEARGECCTRGARNEAIIEGREGGLREGRNTPLEKKSGGDDQPERLLAMCLQLQCACSCKGKVHTYLPSTVQTALDIYTIFEVVLKPCQPSTYLVVALLLDCKRHGEMGIRPLWQQGTQSSTTILVIRADPSVNLVIIG